MANISDALAAFAAGPLGKAAGQDFLSPMLEQARQKDFFTFQRKQIEEGIARDKKKQREESVASRKRLLTAFQQTGAFRDSDLVAAGGVDALAEMDDVEFRLFTAQMTDRRAQEMSDEDLFAMVRGMAAADSRVVIPADGLKSRSQAIQLKAEMDYRLMLEEQNKQSKKETLQDLDRSASALAEQVDALDPLTTTPEQVAGTMAQAQVLQSRTASESQDLGESVAPVATRVGTVLNTLQTRALDAQANVLDSVYAKDSNAFFDQWGQMPLGLQARIEKRPAGAGIITRVGKNLTDLAALSPEEAAVAGVEGAKAAITGIETVEQLMSNPAAARAVFSVDIGAVRNKIRQHGAQQAAKSAALNAHQATTAEMALYGLDISAVNPEDAIEPVWGPEGLQVSFNQQKYQARVLEQLKATEMSQEQALRISRSDRPDPALKTMADEVLVRSLDAGDAALALSNATKVLDEDFVKTLSGFTQALTQIEGREIPLVARSVPQGVTGWRSGDPAKGENPSLYYHKTETYSIEDKLRPVMEKAKTMWRMREFENEANKIRATAEAEAAEMRGTGLEAAAEDNLARATQVLTTETVRKEVRGKIVEAAFAGLMGGGGSALTGEEGFVQNFDLKQLPASAADLVKHIQAKTKAADIVESQREAGAQLPSDEVNRLLGDEFAAYEEIALAIDRGLDDPAHAEALYKAMKHIRPKWVDAPEKMAAWMFLETAQRALND